MKDIYYLRNTLNNIEAWLDGFVCLLHDFVDDDSNPVYSQLLVLYDRQITEIIDHARNIVDDIEKGIIDET